MKLKVLFFYIISEYQTERPVVRNFMLANKLLEKYCYSYIITSYGNPREMYVHKIASFITYCFYYHNILG